MLSCKISAMKLVLLFCRQVFMFLNTQDETLDVSFKGKDGEGSYTAFATTVTLKCNQQESSGEPEPGVNDSQSSGSVEPELEGVSVEHRINANQCNTVTNANVTTTGDTDDTGNSGNNVGTGTDAATGVNHCTEILIDFGGMSHD